jgi:hypothetical protein
MNSLSSNGLLPRLRAVGAVIPNAFDQPLSDHTGMFARPALARHVLLSPVFDGPGFVAHRAGNLFHRFVEVPLAIAVVSIEKSPVDANRIGITSGSKLIALVVAHDSRSGREIAAAVVFQFEENVPFAAIRRGMIRRTCGAFLVVEGRGYRPVRVDMVQSDYAKHPAVAADTGLQRLKGIIVLSLHRLKPARSIRPVLNIVVRQFWDFYEHLASFAFGVWVAWTSGGTREPRPRSVQGLGEVSPFTISSLCRTRTKRSRRELGMCKQQSALCASCRQPRVGQALAADRFDHRIQPLKGVPFDVAFVHWYFFSPQKSWWTRRESNSHYSSVQGRCHLVRRLAHIKMLGGFFWPWEETLP